MRLIVLTGLIFIFTGTSTAQAELTVVFKKSDSVQTTKKKIKVNLKHVGYICNEGTGKPKTEHCRATRWLKHWLDKITAPILPHKAGWICIHGYEAAWNDSGDPYWGGLQMDRGFMTTYGSDFIRRFGGFADKWPIWAQMQAAERAFSGYNGHKGRGYWPWPNTARYCGLL